MLHLILSVAGGGKTTYIMNLIEKLSASGHKKLTLIVPEQFSFTSEKIILGKLGAKAMADIDVESFTSLGEKLIGRPALHERKRLSDSAKAVLMKTALEAVQEKLLLYGKHIKRPSVISEFVALSTEFKRNTLSTEAVRLALSQRENSLLKMKLDDITTVLDTYDSLVENSYFNPDDLLTELCEILPESDYFSGRTVFIDSFRGFTSQEYNALAHMLRKSEDVYITLCTDNLENEDDETGLFAHTKRSAKKLINLAKKEGVAVASPVYLSKNSGVNISRFRSSELSALESELFSPVPEIYEDKCENITLCKASDIYSECEFIAVTAKKLIREKGMRYRDIAVIARDSTSYEAPLKSALRKCGIPVFEDSRQPVEASPVVAFLSSAINICSEGFDTELIMRYLKTGISGFTAEEISEVENYTYLWKINGESWNNEWVQNPRGFGEEASEEDKAVLDNINLIRKRMITPLYFLRNDLRNAEKGKAAEYIFEFLKKQNTAENIRKLAAELENQGESGLAIELERMWDIIIDILDSLHSLSKDRAYSPRELSEILDLMLGVQTVGNLPQGLDEITVGSADRIRMATPKAVFIAGANNGVFPALPFTGSALTDNDRRRMSEMGIELSDYGEYKLAEEKLISYTAFCSASDMLYVCCPEKNSKGEQLAPSELYTKIKNIFPQCKEVRAENLDGLYYVEGEALAFEQLASNRSEGNTLFSTLNEYFRDNPDYEGRISALERASGNRDFKISDKNISQALFGKDMYMSASRVESFYKCPFSYFCRYGIKAMPRAVAELDPMQRGTVIHYALEMLLTTYDRNELSEMSREKLMEFFEKLMTDYLMSRLDGANRSERFLYLFRKLIRSVCDVAQRLIAELSQSKFSPVDFELKIGNDGEIPAYKVETDIGSVIISGSIDRVDEAVLDEKKYIRVVDYKSSGKDFALSDVVQGLNMQMFIYLFALWQNGGKKYGEFTPAGVLYCPANSPVISVERNADAFTVQKEIQKKCGMNGIVLADPAVVTAMDESQSGLYVPAKIKKDTLAGSVIGLKQLEKLKEKADGILVQMADALYNGNISAYPAYGKSYKHVCQYCDYKSVCSYEENISVNELQDYDLKTVLENLERGDDENEMDS